MSIAAASPLVPGLYEQLKFLVVDKGADTTSTDINGYTAVSIEHLKVNCCKACLSLGASQILSN